MLGKLPRCLIYFLIPLLFMIASCGGGGGGGGSNSNGGGETDTPPPPPDEQDDGNDPIDDVSLQGVVVFEQAHHILNKSSVGIMEYHIAEDRLVLWHSGESAKRHPEGLMTAVLVRCGGEDFEPFHSVEIVDPEGLTVASLPCSSDVENGFSDEPLQFDEAVISPDMQFVAVEAFYRDFDENGIFLTFPITLIYDFNGNLYYYWQGGFDPAWTPDNRLLLATFDPGFFLTDTSLQAGVRIDPGQFNTPVTSPSVHPEGTFFAFSYSGQIWRMNLDGTSAERIIIGNKHLRYPAWSPDGNTVVFNAWENLDSLNDADTALYFFDLESQQTLVLNLEGRLQSLGEPWGPLSWTR